MSTLSTTNIKHGSSSINNITLASTGAVAVNGSMTGAGLDLITPTSIAYSGGSASVSGGAVTFSGVSSISLNGCFSAAYENYRILILVTSAPTNGYLQVRLRSAGTDATTAYYSAAAGYAANNVSNPIYAANLGIGYLAEIGGGVALNATTLDMFQPFVADRTAMTFTSTGNNLGLNWAGWGGGVAHGTSASYDGTTFISSGGAMTGKLRIYGYKNS